ncbi:MAG: hypothetical protein BGO69_12120 [Bacteroidetes bacterium 46-16]|nr:MAG: hypothetical protein BGO69_12120 [Bacteroidetes bacterium 46-16]
MSKVYKRSPSVFLPAYRNNAVLQLVIACGVAFVLYHFVEAILWIAGVPKGQVALYMVGNVALPPLALFKTKWWTLFTYGWVHGGFWEMFSNMIWLYCFGSVVQTLVGYRQVIPIFIYSLLIGGVFCLLAQLIPGSLFVVGHSILGAQVGLVALAAAAITIAPKYRLFFGYSFSIPLMVIAAIFLVLLLMSTGMQPVLLLMLLGGGLTGFTYIRLLRNGYRPGAWMYDIFERMERSVTPNEMVARSSKKRKQVLDHVHAHNEVSQKRIDDILDKISRHGYSSLTNEEKEILMKASKEN